MLLTKRKFRPLFSLVLFILLLSGCNGNEKLIINHYYLSLMGESETWKLTDYEVVITPENFLAGNGTLYMKNENEYIVDAFHFETHAVINGEDIVVHSGSASGAGIDIAEETTGAIEGGPYLDKNKKPITLNEVSTIYMIVEWWDIGKSDSLKEKMDLYNKDRKEQTFLN